MFHPVVKNGVCINGCAEISPRAQKLQAAAIDSAVSINDIWDNDGVMPFIAFDSAFEAYVDERIDFMDHLRKKGVCLWPWVVLKEMPRCDRRSTILAWNQGPIPDCTATAGCVAVGAKTILNIAEGVPAEYDAFNALYVHAGITNGAINQGLSTFEVAEWLNTKGAYPVSVVGEDNLVKPQNLGQYEQAAAEYRSAICYITDFSPDQFFRLARAGLPFAFGSATFYSGDTLDSNGMGVGNKMTTGAHSEACLGAYHVVNGTEYVYIQNSHGKNYCMDRTQKPQSGYWVTKKRSEVLCHTAQNYGHPYITFPRCKISKKLSLATGMNLNFPKNAQEGKHDV